MWKKMKPQVPVIRVWAKILVLLCSLPLVDKKGKDYENRVETEPHQMITASKAKKQCLKNVSSNSKTKTWMC